jgi:ABC-type nitrate/sulfonate/bicarbonate transport system substrate-binding protein
MKNKKLIAILAAVAVLIVVGYFLLRPDPPPPPPAIVRIGYPVLRIALPVFVAQEKGLFTKHGLQVELARFETAQPMMDALVGGSLDVGGYCALPITFSAMARSKTPLIFISSMMEDDAHPISMLVFRKGSGLKSIKDLAGKRIGILPTRAYEVWLQKTLAANGVDPTNVVIQQIPPPQQAAALASGAVDALFTNDPASTAAIAKDAGESYDGKALVPETTKINPFYFGSFNVSKRFADANPDAVRRISLALDEAIEFIDKNPEEAKKTMENYLPKEQHGLIAKFPASLFRKTNDTTQQNLNDLLSYYLNEKVLPTTLSLEGAQYRRSE